MSGVRAYGGGQVWLKEQEGDLYAGDSSVPGCGVVIGVYTYGKMAQTIHT